MVCALTGPRKARRAMVETMRLAHTASSPALVGRHAKMRRRLGVSPGPVGLNGPLMLTLSMRGMPSTSTVSTGARSGLRSSGLRAAGLFEERHTNGPRPGLETDANLQTLVDGLGVGRVGEHLAPVVRAADGVQENAFAVDCELEVVGRDESAREVVVAAIEPGADDVLGVERKMLPDRTGRRGCRAAGRARGRADGCRLA